MAQLVGMSEAIGALARDPDMFHPGGLISEHVYHWALDGAIRWISIESGGDGRSRASNRPAER